MNPSLIYVLIYITIWGFIWFSGGQVSKYARFYNVVVCIYDVNLGVDIILCSGIWN